MCDAIASRFASQKSQGGPGSRHGHSFHFEQQHDFPRTRSLPALNVPAGYSQALGNKLGLHHYTDLRGAHNARLDPPPPAPAFRQKVSRLRSVEELAAMEKVKLKPEALPPAGQQKDRKKGKRLCPENPNTLSHVDSLLFACDMDGSDGVHPLAGTELFRGSAGLSAKAERTPVYGEVPPNCVRTFGPHGTTTWDNSRGAMTRVDPRANNAY
eukprot:TRINITY_DN69427_c0_g1_i1.p1 TRINITY_DN69427_c0_g1~~TRINITY_DN69427_c0_g1_i1.p1  ORF type:complete len:212 (+),score=28.73 TRINITY_DN69427_c0_g1_i1:125-760(+)